MCGGVNTDKVSVFVAFCNHPKQSEVQEHTVSGVASWNRPELDLDGCIE